MKEKILVAFDFDGTLTDRDILIPFLKEAFGPKKLLLSLLKLIPTLLLFCIGLRNRQQVKERFLSFFLKKMSPTSFNWLASQFSLFKVPQLIKPQALERLRWHQNQGHEVCIVSANLYPLINPYAKQIGVNKVISSELYINSQDKLTGELKGKNCWGEEKVKRLKEAFGNKEHYTLYAYGDSRGDKELLALAEYPYYRYFPK